MGLRHTKSTSPLPAPDRSQKDNLLRRERTSAFCASVLSISFSATPMGVFVLLATNRNPAPSKTSIIADLYTLHYSSRYSVSLTDGLGPKLIFKYDLSGRINGLPSLAPVRQPGVAL